MPSQVSQNLSSNMDTEVSGPTVWTGLDKAADPIRYITDLSSADIAEIEATLENFKESKKNAPDVNSSTFRLPNLEPRLKAIAKNIHNGTGFSLLRGLYTDRYSDEDNLIIFLGLSSHIGEQRGAQTKGRIMVTHITDAKEWQDVPAEKRHGIHTNSALPFHNDMGCEVLTLLYRRVAAHGGSTSLASASTIYNELLKQPDVLETLMAADWPVQLSGTPPRFESMPLLAYEGGHVIISADPGRLGLHPAMAEEPSDHSRLTEAQLKALKVLNDLAEKHALSIPAESGDILFINNLGVLHKRDSYVDSDSGADVDTKNGNGPAAEKVKPRWLMRLWLRNTWEEPEEPKMNWEIPEAMKIPWEAAYGGGGRLITPKYDPSPQPEYKVPRYTSGTASWLIEDDEEDHEA